MFLALNSIVVQQKWLQRLIMAISVHLQSDCQGVAVTIKRSALVNGSAFSCIQVWSKNYIPKDKQF